MTSFDPSIVGHSNSDIERMCADEKCEVVVDSINRAADIAEHTITAFGITGAIAASIMDAVAELQRVARHVGESRP